MVHEFRIVRYVEPEARRHAGEPAEEHARSRHISNQVHSAVEHTGKQGHAA